MAIFYRIVAMLGGLAMFLYGMRVMGDGLKSNSGGTMKVALAKVTNNPFLAFLLGVFVTCIIQSSHATIVITVGLVGAGFLTFRQSVGIVMGANVGTAITAQIIRLMDVQSGENSIMYFFKADNLAPIALIFGIIVLMTASRESHKNIGNVACGFGVLFMGLIFMSNAVAVFKETLSGLLTAFENNYFLGFVSGIFVTGIIQSSSAVIGIIQSVASSVGVTFNGVFAVIIGVNIGDCLTAFLVSRIGAREEQIRTAAFHIVYNIFAATLIITLLVIGRATGLLNDNFWFASLDSGGVANIHGMFRVIPAVTLLPFSGALAKMTEIIVKDKPVEVDSEDAAVEQELRELDSHLISSPILALDRVQSLLVHMSEVAYKNFSACSKQIYSYEEARIDRIQDREDLLDRITDQTGKYLISMTPYIKRDRDFRMQNFQLKTSVCIERIGDFSVTASDQINELERLEKSFSDSAITELRIVLDAVDEILQITMQAYKDLDPMLARKVEPLEEVIDDMVADINTRHVYRMSKNFCEVERGILFQNILSSLESISDQCSDISIYIIELTETSIIGREHEYIHQLHHSAEGDFQAEYKEKREKYYTRLLLIPTLAELEEENGNQDNSDNPYSD
ncbi:MAG: Na/Pi cotransporter family protein [Lachnospiraceae bacterium]|nr:Na/Pi cotransporter family protein [Lachnospiraceae bacterium]